MSDHDLLIRIDERQSGLDGKVDKLTEGQENITKRCVAEQLERGKIVSKIKSLKEDLNDHQKDHDKKESRNWQKIVLVVGALTTVISILIGSAV